MEAKLSEQPVCAVIVTYHPSVAMLTNLQNVMAEVQGLVVVDNGSGANELDALRAASQELGFHLIENGTNLGIAEALNQGVRWAKTEGYPWVLLLDQDSRMSDGFVEAMLETWLFHPKPDQAVSIHPRYFDPVIGRFGIYAPRAADGSPVWSMTSGALMPVWIFDKIGWFLSDFFIDWVDIEYCFRIRKAGYLIAESQQAVLVHAPGRTSPACVFGFQFWPSHHSPARRYYMFRNRVVVFRKYLFSLPYMTLKAMSASFRDTVKCFLGEKDRTRKFRSFLRGTWDGLIGRMGMREGL